MQTMLSMTTCAAGMIMGCSNGDHPQAEKSIVQANSSTVMGTSRGASNPMQASGWELVPKAEYTASQTPDEVIIVARGEAPTGGYEVKFVQSPLKIYPPHHQLYWKKPTGPATMALVPFEVTTAFKASDPVPVVTVTDGAGQHEVKVDQARD